MIYYILTDEEGKVEVHEYDTNVKTITGALMAFASEFYGGAESFAAHVGIIAEPWGYGLIAWDQNTNTLFVIGRSEKSVRQDFEDYKRDTNYSSGPEEDDDFDEEDPLNDFEDDKREPSERGLMHDPPPEEGGPLEEPQEESIGDKKIVAASQILEDAKGELEKKTVTETDYDSIPGVDIDSDTDVEVIRKALAAVESEFGEIGHVVVDDTVLEFEVDPGSYDNPPLRIKGDKFTLKLVGQEEGAAGLVLGYSIVQYGRTNESKKIEESAIKKGDYVTLNPDPEIDFPEELFPDVYANTQFYVEDIDEKEQMAYLTPAEWQPDEEVPTKAEVGFWLHLIHLKSQK